MRRFAFSMLAALLLFTATAAGALAAPSPEPNPAGPYEGKFRGTVWAGGSGAPLSVNLTHRGNVVAGTASLGEGLVVKSRFCGSASIPAATQQLNGYTQPGRLGHLEATTTFRAQGIPVTIYFSSDVSADGKTVNGAATLDIPWFCGSDPVLTGTLHKATY
jgi:hypothetical protein